MNLSSWQMPPEWHPHAGCWLAWPCRDEIWGLGVDAAKRAYAEVIDAISESEPVTLLVRPEQLEEAQKMVPSRNVTLVSMALDDSWARDTMPLFVGSQNGQQGAVNFRFNAWGEKFTPYAQDAAMGQLVLDRLAQQRRGFTGINSQLILEGGSIHVDGEGTLLTTSECLLNPNRNPHLTQAQIETELCQQLGADKVLWLPNGVYGDVDTDGHVDNIATFTAPGRVLTMSSESPSSPNYERYQANHDALAEMQDAKARSLTVVDIPEPEQTELNGEVLALSYINYYLANEAVVMPAFGQSDRDQEAQRIIQAEFTDREVVVIDAMPILAGGGGIHCITMQEPR